MSLAIWGLGTAWPEGVVTQEQAAKLTSQIAGHDVDQTRRLAALYRKSGVKSRHVALLDQVGELGSVGPSTRWRMERYEEAIGPIAHEAASKAMSESGIEAGEITHLVTVSCTGFSAPGFDLGLFGSLGLDRGVQRTHVGFMGCHGALNGLRVARAFAGSDRSARVLLVSAELCSLHFRYGWDSDLAVSNALFADGAAALVGRADPRDEAESWRVVAGGSTLMPDTADAMSWRVGDQGFEMTLSPRIAAHVAENLGPWLETWLARRGLKVADIGCWAIHPGGPRVLDAVETALRLERSATADSREILASCGNMSSPTVLFIIDRLRKRGAKLPCVAMAFGPGLTIEAALIA